MKYNENQLKAINANGNIVVVASAGSGKSSVIVARVKRMIEDGVDPSSILCITFSRKAKDNLIERLNDDTVNVETFHSFALKVIIDKYKGKYTVWTKQWEKEKVIQDALKTLGLFDPKNPNQYLKDCMKFIATQKHKMIGLADKMYFNGFMELTTSQYRKVYEAYEAFRFRNNYIEFDDFVNMACAIFENDSKLLERYKKHYKYIMADEYQDVSVAQATMLKLLNEDQTMIVGDPLQAIYAFRGGDSKFILNFDKDYKDVTVVNLDTNYRCKNSIVTSSNSFASGFISDTKHRNYVESKANRDGGFDPIITAYDTEQSEADNIAKKIKESGHKPSEVAVLARCNAQLQNIQNSLGMERIPFCVYGGCLYTEQAEIKLLLSYLKLANDTNDNEAFQYMYNKPNRWLGSAFLEEVHRNSYGSSFYDSMFTIRRRNWKFKNGIDEIIGITEDLQRSHFENVGEMVKYLRHKLPIDDYFNKGEDEEGEFAEKVESMNAFQRNCERFKTIKDLLSYLDILANSNNEKSDAVKLMTIHKSKGMEFPIVYLIGCNDGKFPHYLNNNPEDEARVMYVGMTRAADELYMSYVGQPSEFLLTSKEN